MLDERPPDKSLFVPFSHVIVSPRNEYLRGNRNKRMVLVLRLHRRGVKEDV